MGYLYFAEDTKLATSIWNLDDCVKAQLDFYKQGPSNIGKSSKDSNL